MARITKEQVTKWNEQLSNGWKLDLQRLAYYGEKDICLIDKIDENKYIEYKLWYAEKYNHTLMKKYYILTLTKSEWTKTGEMFGSFGLGYSKEIETGIEKKQYKKLIEFSKKYTLEDVKSLYTGEEVNPFS